MAERTRLLRKRHDQEDARMSAGREEVDSVLRSSSARPLDPGVRARLEPSFGYDFSTVRVHTDAPATQSAASLNARAYTVGSDIVFNEGAYAPESSTGQQLIAHELAHVVQQSTGAVPAASGDRLDVSQPGDSLESSADGMASAAMSAAPAVAATPAGGIVQRAAENEGEEELEEPPPEELEEEAAA